MGTGEGKGPEAAPRPSRSLPSGIPLLTAKQEKGEKGEGCKARARLHPGPRSSEARARWARPFAARGRGEPRGWLRSKEGAGRNVHSKEPRVETFFLSSAAEHARAPSARAQEPPLKPPGSRLGLVFFFALTCGPGGQESIFVHVTWPSSQHVFHKRSGIRK